MGYGPESPLQRQGLQRSTIPNIAMKREDRSATPIPIFLRNLCSLHGSLFPTLPRRTPEVRHFSKRPVFVAGTTDGCH